MENVNSIVEQVFINSKLIPDKVAIIHGKKEVTYRSLKEYILSAKMYLESTLDIRKDDRIVLATDKNIEFIYTYFAIHLIGAIAIPVAVDINDERLCFVIENTKSKCIIGLSTTSLNVQTHKFPILEGQQFSNIEYHFPEKEDISDLLFTTGTTGIPKGVQLTHSNLVASARNINEFIGNKEEDIEIIALPISHSFGLGRIRCALSKGSTLILLGSFASVKKLFRLMALHNVSGLAMVPSAWQFLKKMSGDRISEFKDQLKYIEFGSAFLPLEDKHVLMKYLPKTRICMHYGLTEASRSCFIEFHSEFEQLETIGKPSPNVEVKIFDSLGNELAPGQEGEICVKGEHVLNTYWKLPSEDYFYGSFFRTGDFGYCNEKGYIVLAGRIKETINVGGKKLNPMEVETQIDLIQGVEESVCVGIPDKNGVLGEVVKAFVVKSDEKLVFEDIKTALAGKLESYKMPVEYEWIEEIPKTKSGKIQRLKLKGN
ncbi:acyl--CoA ligase [Carboxylicivirga sediminis]|uniref:Acyl--CoA ligase n=1 Tax=Carboxylicivirga sediminis TaxID=2006564 RepID=A0A941F8B3_9BACT|nr:class I adenylate-forming enzyme family protein [Carboxylicivirga sediminis]MBR8537394.1 acyl--CoA ligase [Carboxylicivirga sediminis]